MFVNSSLVRVRVAVSQSREKKKKKVRKQKASMLRVGSHLQWFTHRLSHSEPRKTGGQVRPRTVFQ